MSEFDIAIIGGGLAGTAAAIALAKKGYATVQFAPEAPKDRRTSALMGPSVDFLVENGLIDAADAHATPLEDIRIIDATNRLIRAPETLFRAEEIGCAAFGWNFANAPLLAHLAGLAATLPKLTVIAEPATDMARGTDGFAISTASGTGVSARLLVGADGRTSPVRSFAGIRARTRPFAEAALVCDLALARPLGTTSVEFHYEKGPFTLVPAGGDKANLVWIDSPDILEAAMAGDLAAATTEKSQRLFGALTVTSPAAVFPLSMLGVTKAGQDGIALVGEAAHAFPPIGAQGLNLGLRDVADLVITLAQVERDKPDWANTVSHYYANRRSGDLMRTSSGVEALFRSLLADFLPAQAARAGGLWALKAIPGLRHMAMRAGMGGR